MTGGALPVELHHSIAGRGIELFAIRADRHIQRTSDAAKACPWFGQGGRWWRRGLTDQIKAHRWIGRIVGGQGKLRRANAQRRWGAMQRHLDSSAVAVIDGGGQTTLHAKIAGVVTADRLHLDLERRIAGFV